MQILSDLRHNKLVSAILTQVLESRTEKKLVFLLSKGLQKTMELLIDLFLSVKALLVLYKISLYPAPKKLICFSIFSTREITKKNYSLKSSRRNYQISI